MNSRLAASLLFFVLLGGAYPFAGAQTYTPKSIRFEGAGDLDQAQIRHLIDLPEGAPVTREQIEAAMQRLADSGLFSNLSYKVDTSALTFVLEPASGSQAQPVRYANFVFWRPGELEPLVEQRVPLFHGKLPLTGQLTMQVEAALVALLADRGVAGAQVEAQQSTLGGVSGVALVITQPEIRVGSVEINGVAPEAAAQVKILRGELAGRDFDSVETADTLRTNTLDAHRNAGYLDATATAPVFAAPHKDQQGYAVDGSETVQPGALFRIAALHFTGVDPRLEAEIAKASGLAVGDPAGAMTLTIGAGLAARVLSDQGHLEAKATPQQTRDTAAHTVQDTVTLLPGPVYTLAGVDTTALSSAAQERFQQNFKIGAGAVADKTVTHALVEALQSVGVLRSTTISQRLDRQGHTVTYVVVSRAAAGIR